jgi:hypothetical protein
VKLYLPAWSDEASYEPEAEAEQPSCFSGPRRLSGRIFVSFASIVFLAYLVL